MNYFSRVFFSDYKYWLWVSLGGLVILLFADITLNIFNFWYVIAFLTAAFVSIPLYIYFWHKRKKLLEFIEQNLPPFEAKRKEEIKNILVSHPGFQTFCYECKFFNSQIKGCSLHLFNRRKEFKFNPTDRVSYCLYWNATLDPRLLKAADHEFDGSMIWTNHKNIFT